MSDEAPPITKADLIHYRDTTVNGELKRTLRWSVKRIEDLETRLREIDVMTKSIRRIIESRD